MTPRLKELYLKEIQPALKTEFGFKNLNMGPKIEKIILNHNEIKRHIIDKKVLKIIIVPKKTIIIVVKWGFFTFF